MQTNSHILATSTVLPFHPQDRSLTNGLVNPLLGNTTSPPCVSFIASEQTNIPLGGLPRGSLVHASVGRGKTGVISALALNAGYVPKFFRAIVPSKWTLI